MGSIYIRPILAALPVIAITYRLRSTILPGASWFQFFAAAALIPALYYSFALLICVDREHRSLLWGWLDRKWNAFRVNTTAA
jgi:hypothetical protein